MKGATWQYQQSFPPLTSVTEIRLTDSICICWGACQASWAYSWWTWNVLSQIEFSDYLLDFATLRRPYKDFARYIRRIWISCWSFETRHLEGRDLWKSWTLLYLYTTWYNHHLDGGIRIMICQAQGQCRESVHFQFRNIDIFCKDLKRQAVPRSCSPKDAGLRCPMIM